MLKNWPVLLLAFVLIAVIGVSCYTDPSNQKEQNGANNSSPVSTISQAQPDQTHQGANTSEDTPFWRKVIAWPTGVTCVAVVFTLFFIGWQAFLTRQAIVSADSASKTELRAYIGVLINSATYQERDKNIKFAGVPTLTNTGKTPAHKVRYRNNAAILQEPLAQGYVFPAGQDEIGEYVLGMNQPMIMRTEVADYCDPQDADDILHGRGNRALYSWGTVYYIDAFGNDHETQFCHRLYFNPDPDNPGNWKVLGHYMAGRNKAT